MVKPNLDHPTLPLVKQRFPNVKLLATEFRGQTTLVVPKNHLHEVLAFLRQEPDCRYDFLSDVTGIDYLHYPAPQGGLAAHAGRFGVVYNLVSTTFNRRLLVKAFVSPTLDTSGIEDDPALHLPTV